MANISLSTNKIELFFHVYWPLDFSFVKFLSLPIFSFRLIAFLHHRTPMIYPGFKSFGYLFKIASFLWLVFIILLVSLLNKSSEFYYSHIY